MDVRPHPPIRLAIVTYLFSGAVVHRDTLVSVQSITVGDVNWMTAGRGIAHSERTDDEERSHPNALHGLQSWVALSHVILLGGEPFPEKRFIWWNFVSTSEDRIVQAKQDWKSGRFGKIPGDEKEFVALPE